MASASRHRDHHLRARRNRRTRRQHGESRRHCRRRCAVDDRRQRNHSSGNAQRRPGRPDARLPVVGQSSGVAQDDGTALPGGESQPKFLVKDDDGTHVRVVCGNFWGKDGPVDGIAADPIYLDVSVAPGRRKTLPVETTRHAFAYVFGGSGKFCNASAPLFPCPPKRSSGRTRVLRRRQTIVRWCSSIEATK